ncbi:MAG: hypothetical protein WD674_01400 [Cucumibacter sp.]
MLAAASALVPLAAPAQQNPFAGETLEILSSSGEGSPSNLMFAFFATALEKQLPDTRIVFRSNAGGSSALSAAMVAEAEPNGLIIGTIDMDSIIAKITGVEVYDVSEFAMLGSLGRDVDLLFASTPSGIASIAELIGRSELAVLPVRATTSGGYFQGLLVNAVLGTRIQPVTGYSTGARELAFLNGEAQLNIIGLDTAEQIIADAIGVPILKTADVDIPPRYGNPPALSSFAANPQFRWIVDYLNTALYSHILAAPKATPPDRLEALRTAFMAATVDPEMQAVSESLLALDPIPGAEIEAGIASMMAQMDSFAGGLNRALECGLKIAETGKECTQ